MSFMLFLALLPAAVLMIYIYRKDKVEKEPFLLLAGLFLLGAATIVPACIAELVFGGILKVLFFEGTVPYMVIENFLIVALSEEVCKYFILRRLTWRSPHFNYTFDAVVYAVAVSLGFAAFENVLYVLDGTVRTAIMRAILSVPGHAIDGVFMGFYYGIAKKCSAAGNAAGAKMNLQKALAVPVLLHGFYDFCLDMSSDAGIFLLVFFAFEIIITILAMRKVNRLSVADESLVPETPPDFPYGDMGDM